MKSTMRKTGPSLSAGDLKNFENEIGFKLPAQYRKFMLENNGGRLTRNFFRVPGWRYRNSLVNEFDCIIPDGSGFGIRQILEITGDIYPEGFIPIGGDPGGNTILMGLKKPFRNKIYFWDHEAQPDHRLERVEDYLNMYFLADSFEEFTDNLKNENEL